MILVGNADASILLVKPCRVGGIVWKDQDRTGSIIAGYRCRAVGQGLSRISLRTIRSTAWLRRAVGFDAVGDQRHCIVVSVAVRVVVDTISDTETRAWLQVKTG